MVVSLSKKGKEKKGKLEYTTVTQVVVSLSPSECNVPAISQLVSQQLGFQAILLDCKCYPLVCNESTSGIDFWNSTQKILAASKDLYGKVTGLDPENSVIGQALELTGEGPSPIKRRIEVPRPDASPMDMKLVLEKLSNIEKKITFLDELSHGLNCVICKWVAQKLVVSPCCQRVIGCEVCVNSWISINSRCPLCGLVEH